MRHVWSTLYIMSGRCMGSLLWGFHGLVTRLSGMKQQPLEVSLSNERAVLTRSSMLVGCPLVSSDRTLANGENVSMDCLGNSSTISATRPDVNPPKPSKTSAMRWKPYNMSRTIVNHCTASLRLCTVSADL